MLRVARTPNFCKVITNNNILQADPTDNFSTAQQAELLHVKDADCFQVSTKNQSNWVVFFTSKQLFKGAGTQNKERILFLWIGFLVIL